jgi:FMN hydrolase / 5-amino-6-(5-phospho-D-ribitylamino)uracil phosphatase
MIRAVCFDLMGTLVHDPYESALRAATGLELDELAGLKDPDCWALFELGEIDEAEFAHRFFVAPGHHFDVEAFNRVRRSEYRLLPGMAELVERLHGRVELHIASNYPLWISELREMFELDRRFEGVWASHQLGARKPDPEFFTRLLDKVGHPAGACLFVDDREDNCRAAHEVGFSVHHFAGVEGLTDELRCEGLLR